MKKIIKKIKYKVMNYVYRNNNEKHIIHNYKYIMGTEPNLENPKSYNEKINWLKLNYRNKLYEECSDKVLVRDYIKSKKLENILTKLYGVYDNLNEINWDTLPQKFVIKTTHSSGGVVVVKNKNDMDKSEIKKIINKSLKENLYFKYKEWQYKNLKPRIMIEELIESKNKHLTDYKFFCFDGKVECIYVASGVTSSEKDYCIDFYDKDWNWLKVSRVGHKNLGAIKKPAKFEEMKKIAQTLSKEFSHVRVDLFCENNKIYFGELTFTTGGGYGKFSPNEYDYELGSKWNISKLKKEIR